MCFSGDDINIEIFLLSSISNTRLNDTNYDFKCQLPHSETYETLCPRDQYEAQPYNVDQMSTFYEWRVQTSSEYFHMLNASRFSSSGCQIARHEIQHPWTCSFPSEQLNTYVDNYTLCYLDYELISSAKIYDSISTVPGNFCRT